MASLVRLSVFVLLAGFLLGGCVGGSGEKVVTVDGNNGAGVITIGEVESVRLAQNNIDLTARVDTGAQTSSLDARNIVNIERDGKKWVRFEVVAAGKKTVMEKPLARTLLIKQHGREALKRPVVKLDIFLAGKRMQREFSLADRSNFKYPVLVGRNVLQGSFIVDVSRKNAGSAMSEASK